MTACQPDNLIILLKLLLVENPSLSCLISGNFIFHRCRI
jgi:hypothetical protein